MTRRYGWKPDTPDQRDHVFRVARPVPLPPDFDPRGAQPPVFDQGQLGSCTGNGIAAELEAQALAQRQPLVVLSRLFIYYNERDMEGTTYEDAGASIRDGIKSVARLGACPETLWPYRIERFAERPPEECYREALRHTALQYQRVPQELAAIKTAILSGHGLVLGISVYPSFEAPEVARTGVVPMPEASEVLLGGHCVRLIGWADNGLEDIPPQHFIGMNSWGTGWGLGGFFALPYAYVTSPGLADDLWDVQAVS